MSATFSNPSDEIVTQDVIDTVADALQRATNYSASAIKEVALRLKTPRPTVKNWFAKRNCPSATELIRLMRELDEVYDAVSALAGRTPAKMTEEQADRMRQALDILLQRKAA